MMLTRLTFLIALLCMALVSWANPDQNAVKAGYASFDKAFSSKNVAGLKALVAPGATFKSQGQPAVKADDAFKQMGAQLSMMKKANAKTTVQMVTLKGATATAMVSQVMTMTMANPQTKKDSIVVLRTKSLDTWVKIGNAWKLKATNSTLIEMLMDGKKVPTGPPAKK